MRLQETIGSLVRQWYIVVLGLLVTMALCWVVQERVPTTYVANGSQVLMPPSASVGTEGNPYLHLGGMNEALDLLIRHVTATEVVENVVRGISDTTYVVQADHGTSGSVILISASGPSAEHASEVLQAALNSVPAALTGMQDQLAVPEHQRISVRTVVVDSQTTRNDQNRLRLTLFAAGVGIVGTISLAVSSDGVMLGKNRARVARRAKRHFPYPTVSGGADTKEPSRATHSLDPKSPPGEASPDKDMRPGSKIRTGSHLS